MGKGQEERYFTEDPQPAPPLWSPHCDQVVYSNHSLLLGVGGECCCTSIPLYLLVLERLSFPWDPVVWLGGPGVSH